MMHLQPHTASRALLAGCMFLAVCILITGCRQAWAFQSVSSPPRALVTHYCVGCHNQKLKTAGVTLDGPRDIASQPELWEKVDRKLRTRSMPPAGLPRPDEASYQDILTAVETALDTAAAAHPNPGPIETFRRLNRTVYHNAVRDLLAIDLDVDSLLPADESSHGFDNVTVSDLSPTLLERYVTAARKIGRVALGRPVRLPGGDTVTLPPDLTQEQHFDGFPIGTRGGLAVPYDFPADAVYEINVRLTRDRNEHVEGLTEPHDVEVLLDGNRVGLVTVKPPPPGNDFHLIDKDLNFRVPVPAGPHLVAATFPKRPTLLLETERQPYQAHFNMDRHPRIQPAVYSLSVNGPYDIKGPGDSPSRRRVLVCKPAAAGEEHTCAVRILSTLMRRAYRRPVTDADLAGPLRFYEEGRKEGDFEAGIEMGLRAVLVSPEFLFHVNQPSLRKGRPAGIRKAGDFELASELSFFLWSSIPDDELLDAAAAGSSAIARLSSSRRGGCSPIHARRRSSTTSPSSGSTCATSIQSGRTCASSRISTTTCARRSAARRSCSLRASCARTATSRICCGRTTHF